MDRLTDADSSFANMGSNAHVEYTGIEAHVRKVLHKDEHIVLGILGGYAGLYVIIKGVMAMGGGSKPKNVDTPIIVSSSDGGIPDVEDPGFEKFIENESNVSKLIESWSK